MKTQTPEINETRPNDKIFRYKPYIPGKPIEVVARENNLQEEEILKLASNENLLGPSPMAVEGARKAIKDIHLYPDTICRELRSKIGQQIGLPPKSIYVSNGGVETIFNLAAAYLAPEDEVIMGAPSFGAFFAATRGQGAEVIQVPLKDYRMDCQKMIEAITPKTKIIYLVNPNNPTGSLTPEKEIQSLLKKAPDNIIVLIDEAYWVFAEDVGLESAIKFVHQGHNVLILRSLSKHLGIAGLRLGYAFGRQAIIDNLFQVHLPFHVNLVAQKAAIAGLDDSPFITKTLEMLRTARTFFEQALTKRGLTFAPSAANFIFVELGRDDVKFCKELEKRGIIVRPGSGLGQPGAIRVTFGTETMNERFFQVFDEVMAIFA